MGKVPPMLLLAGMQIFLIVPSSTGYAVNLEISIYLLSMKRSEFINQRYSA